MYQSALENLADFDIGGGMPLDAGIRRYVLILRAERIETIESCEGGNGHAFFAPTVRFHGAGSGGYRAFAVAMSYELPVYSLRRYYRVTDGQLAG